MLKITTKSGAVYLYDAEGGRVQRLEGEMNPGMRLDNGEWANMSADNIEIGKSIRFVGAEFWRMTTPVVSIEDAA